jgi:aryl-alcohol dehydrogenase-like predicted oxidoreductase
MALMVWSPLSGGYLSGKYTAQNGTPAKGRRTNLNFPPIDPRKAAARLFGVLVALSASLCWNGASNAQSVAPPPTGSA